MKLIRQRGGVDCGIATVAMVSGVSYRKASEVAPVPSIKKGLSVPNMLKILKGLTGVSWKVRKPKPKTVLLSEIPDRKCVLLIRKAGTALGHWVAWDGRVVHDPEHDRPCAISKYPRRQWNLIRLLYRA